MKLSAVSDTAHFLALDSSLHSSWEIHADIVSDSLCLILSSAAH